MSAHRGEVRRALQATHLKWSRHHVLFSTVTSVHRGREREEAEGETEREGGEGDEREGGGGGGGRRKQKRRDKREGGRESFIFTISTTSDGP